MLKFILLLLLINFSLSQPNQDSPCPIQNQVGSVISSIFFLIEAKLQLHRYLKG